MKYKEKIGDKEGGNETKDNKMKKIKIYIKIMRQNKR